MSVDTPFDALMHNYVSSMLNTMRVAEDLTFLARDLEISRFSTSLKLYLINFADVSVMFANLYGEYCDQL